MNTKIDTVESNFDAKLDFIREGMFTPDEKASILDTVKLVNDHLVDNVIGKGNIYSERIRCCYGKSRVAEQIYQRRAKNTNGVT